MLASNSYGKSRVRLLKLWPGEQHSFKEFTVETTLEGDFTAAYTHSDNANIIPTDTQKNLVYVVAHENTDWRCAEEYAAALAAKLASYNAIVTRATVAVQETCYERLELPEPHPHSFRRLAARRTARAVRTGGRLELWGGLAGYTLLKTTGSGFTDFHRCAHTSLRNTTDRFCASEVQAEWRFSPVAAAAARLDGDGVASRVRLALDRAFARHYSPSVQATQFWAATQALADCPEIDEVRLEMPNLHVLGPVDLSAAGVPNNTDVFLPTSEPHGTISCAVQRQAAARL